jgi:hypothetical protein
LWYPEMLKFCEFGDMFAVSLCPDHRPRVPHISLVFREMRDTTGIDCSLSKDRARLQCSEDRAVESHISRKTSEMWGTTESVVRTRVKKDAWLAPVVFGLQALIYNRLKRGVLLDVNLAKVAVLPQ